MRLSRARDIQRVFRSGLKISNAYVTLRARRGAARTARLGFAVARKHVDSAVRRNRIKRIARESFRRHASLLCGLDIVVVSRATLRDADGAELRRCLDSAWEKLYEQSRHKRTAR